jgi:hypothetical protein
MRPLINYKHNSMTCRTKTVSMKLGFNKWVLLQVLGYWRPRHHSLTGDLCLESTMMIKTHHHRRRSNSSLVLASPWLVPSLGEGRGITSSPFTHLLFK